MQGCILYTLTLSISGYLQRNYRKDLFLADRCTLHILKESLLLVLGYRQSNFE